MLVDPLGAQEEVLNLASLMGLEITVAVAYESSFKTQGAKSLCCLKVMINLSTM